ncbi:hypothetical protein ABT234_05140 [Streptomyces sp. NPDC001586]|uniref:hypothetical protein n=1 Tax=unclassified Streptomyces TaxID=2593676 RepID=UPI0033319FF3
MSDQQQPDEQDDRAVYRRADASKFPTTEAGQRAAVEGMAAAMGHAQQPEPEGARNPRQPAAKDSALGRLQRNMRAVFEEYEQEQRAEIRAAGGGPDDLDELEPLTRDYLVHIARAHRNATRAGGAALDGLLDQIALDLDLYDVRAMRGAWAAITDAMPRIAYAARQDGKSPDEIAQATGYTTSRIAQFVRQEKQRRDATPLARYSWRVDTLASDGTWTNREHGEGDLDPDNLPSEASRLLDESGAHTGRARIFLWEGDGGDDDAAAHTLDRNQH